MSRILTYTHHSLHHTVLSPRLLCINRRLYYFDFILRFVIRCNNVKRDFKCMCHVNRDFFAKCIGCGNPNSFVCEPLLLENDLMLQTFRAKHVV